MIVIIKYLDSWVWKKTVDNNRNKPLLQKTNAKEQINEVDEHTIIIAEKLVPTEPFLPADILQYL